MTSRSVGVRRHAPDPEPATLACRRCGRACEPFGGHGGHYRHARALCGAPMRYGQSCARAAGHRGVDTWGAGHRTVDALAFDRARRQPHGKAA